MELYANWPLPLGGVRSWDGRSRPAGMAFSMATLARARHPHEESGGDSTAARNLTVSREVPPSERLKYDPVEIVRPV